MHKETLAKKFSLCSNLNFPPLLLRRSRRSEGGLKLWVILQLLGSLSMTTSPQMFGRSPPLYIQTGSHLTWTLSSGLVDRLISRTTTEAVGQTALWVSAPTPDILPHPPLRSKALESIVLHNWVLTVTWTTLELSHKFKMWLFKVVAPISGAWRSRHKPALQLLWVDMVSAINWNVSHF